MKHLITLSLALSALLCSHFVYSQSVGIGTETPNANAILELVAPNNDQGLLVPRMTTSQRTATTFTDNLSTTDNGLMVYDSDENKFYFWINDAWMELSSGNLGGLPDQAGQSGNYLTTDGSNAQWSTIDFSTLSNIPAGLSDGDNVDDADADPSNEIQDISSDGTSGNISLSNGSILTLNVDDADADASNELQNLNLTTNTLSLSGSASTIDLSGYLDNTDTQNLDFTAGVISLSGDPDATTIDLSNYDSDVTDDFDGAFTSLTAVPAGLSDGDDVDDADNDPSNELQDISTDGSAGNITLSNGSTLTLNVNDADASASNEIQDISSDGTAGNLALSSGSTLTLNVDDADADATNELQDLSLSGNTLGLTNSSITVDLTPFAGTNTDNQTLSLAGTDLSISGGNILDVTSLVDDADADPTNEIQDISTTGAAGNISLSSGSTLTLNVNDADASPTNEIQDISTSGAAGNITLSSGSTLNLNVDDADASATNEIELPTQSAGDAGLFLQADGAGGVSYVAEVDGSTTNELNTGMSLSGTTIQVTDAGGTQGVDIGGTFATDSELAAINESQWTTNGVSINYTTGNVNIGAATAPTSKLQLTTTTTNGTTPQLNIYETDASSDAAMYFRSSGTNMTMGIDATDGYFKLSAANTLTANNRLIIDNLGKVGIGASPNAHLYVNVSGASTEGAAIRVNNLYSGTGNKNGLWNVLNNQGTNAKNGVYNEISGTTGETGALRGLWNVISPTEGPVFGEYTQINSGGDGIRAGNLYNINVAAANTSDVYGVRSNVNSSGSGTSYGYYANVIASGTSYGFYSVGDALNFFEGNVGIGGDLSPTHQLSILSTTTNSTNPMVRVRSGNSSSDAAIYMNIQGGGGFTYGIDATESTKFKISNSTVLGTNDRLILTSTGELGLNQNSPSATLDVVGTTELNGNLTVSGTLNQITGTSNLITGASTVNGFLTVTDGVQITNDYSYFNGKVHYLSFHPTDFHLMRRDGRDQELVVPFSGNDFYAYHSGTSGVLVYSTAPVRLPDEAEITNVDAWVYDNSTGTSDFVRVELIESTLASASSNTVIATPETTPAFNSTSVTLISSPTLSYAIDNSTYSYRLVFTAPENTNLRLHGVRITYEVLKAD